MISMGLTEICGPGVGGECECQNGTHLWEDHFFPEIVDPVTLEPVEPGQARRIGFHDIDKRRDAYDPLPYARPDAFDL